MRRLAGLLCPTLASRIALVLSRRGWHNPPLKTLPIEFYPELLSYRWAKDEKVFPYHSLYLP
jgi:hypothetical protein